MEERKELKTIRVNYKCPKCYKGYLIRSGKSICLTDHIEYPHYCDNADCNYSEKIKDKIYPYTYYEEI